MSKELEVGLAGISADEFMSALLHVHLKQNDVEEAQTMVSGFEDKYPELIDGMTILDVITERSGITEEQKQFFFQGVMIGFMALREVVEVRQINDIIGQ